MIQEGTENKLTKEERDRNDRVIQLYSISGCATLNDFAQIIGASQSKLSHIKAYRNAVSIDIIIGIMNAIPNISSEWLLFGRGEMYSDGKRTGENSLFEAKEEGESAENGGADGAESVSVVGLESAGMQNIGAGAQGIDTEAMGNGAEAQEGASKAQGLANKTPEIVLNREEDLAQNKAQEEENGMRNVVGVQVAESRQETAQNVTNEGINRQGREEVVGQIDARGKKGRVRKIVVLYDDETFAEYRLEKV